MNVLCPGNATFHDDTLYSDLAEAISASIRLIHTELDDRTRANAAGVLGNLVKNSSLLCEKMHQAGAVSVLMNLVREYMQREDDAQELTAAGTALFTLGNFCSYPFLKSQILDSDVQTLLQKAGTSSNASVLQHGQRLCRKLQDTH